MKYWAYSFSKFTLWVVFRWRCGLEVTGQHHIPTRGPFILASNHRSFLDPPVLGAACPRRLSFMARADLFERRWLGTYMRAVHVIPLRRGEVDPAAIREAIHRLRQGEAIAIFPEGGRQLSGKLGTAKRGVGFLAVTARVPIIPVLIQGTFEALPPGERRLHPAKIRVAFGPPIPYTNHSAPVAPHEGGGLVQARASRGRDEALADVVTRYWHTLERQDHG